MDASHLLLLIGFVLVTAGWLVSPSCSPDCQFCKHRSLIDWLERDRTTKSESCQLHRVHPDVCKGWHRGKDDDQT